MKDALVTSLPILSLFLGAWLTGRTKKADVRGTMRLEAADLMADIQATLWKKGGEDDWLNVRMGLDRLRFRLCLAGLPPAVAHRLAEGGETFWQNLEWYDDLDEVAGWAIVGDDGADWNQAETAVVQWLADNSRLRRRFRLWREVRKWEPPKGSGANLTLGESGKVEHLFD